MAWALVQSAKKSVTGVSSSTKAFDSNVTAGNLLVVWCALYDPAAPSGWTISTPTDTQSNTYHPANDEQIFTIAAANRGHGRMYYTIANSSGANTVTFGQANTSGTYHTVLLAEFSGCDAQTRLTARAVAQSNSGSTTPVTASAYTGDGVLLVGAIINAVTSGTATYTEGSGYSSAIEETDANTWQTAAMEYKTASGDGNYTAGYTTDNVSYAIQMAAFIPAESNAGGYTPPTVTDIGVTDASQSATGFPDIRPNALFDASAGTSGKLIVPYIGNGSNLCLAVYDLNSAAWTITQDLATGGEDDGHGSPSIVLGFDNKYHIAWGSHQTDQLYIKSDSAHDPSAWTAQADIATPATYPNLFRISNGGTDYLVLVYRKGGHTADWGSTYSTNHGSSWTGADNILDGTAANVWYLSIVQESAGSPNLHFIVTWEDETNTHSSAYPLFVRRYGQYYFKWNWATGTVTAADGDTSGTKPLTKTYLDAHCIVRSDANPLFDQEPRVILDRNSKPCWISIRGTDQNHIATFCRWSSGSLTSSQICCTGIDHTNDCGLLVETSASNFSAFIVRKGSGGYTGDYDSTSNPVDIGGNVDEYRSTDDGATWTRMGQVSTGTAGRLNFVAEIEGAAGTACPFRYLAADYVDIGDDDGKIYAWTDAAAATGNRRRRVLLCAR